MIDSRAKAAWAALAAHATSVTKRQLRELFAEDPERGQRLAVQGAGLYLDYSKNRVTDETMRLLLELAEASNLRARIDAMFRGEKTNLTEKRATRDAKVDIDGKNAVLDDVLDRMAALAESVRSGRWKGYTGRRIRNVVNIGIGGFDLGPVMAYEALKHYTDRELTLRFVSNTDGTDFAEAVRDLSPYETLFIVSSKTFTTLETMTNARAARAWLLAGMGGHESSVARHFVAVSTNAAEVAKFGIDVKNMLGSWDWVGGRYSIGSTIGLSTMIAVGPDTFRATLRGSQRMDEHFQSAPFSANLPIVLGLLSLWHNTFFAAPARVLPYERYLKGVPAYLPQLTLESDGKRVVFEGEQVSSRASNTFLTERMTPEVLGSLVALYEYSLFTQCALSNDDSFDQWGGELGKLLAQRIVAELSS